MRTRIVQVETAQQKNRTQQRPDGWQCAKPVVWLKAIRSVPIDKAVCLALALSADRQDGKNARPGLSRLQWESGKSRSTVVQTLESLEAMDLIFCAERNERGGRGRAKVYWLTVHNEIETRYGVSFEEWEARRRPSDKGSRLRPFVAQAKGSPPGPFEAVKGPEDLAKGSRNSSQRVPVGTAPGSTPGKYTSSDSASRPALAPLSGGDHDDITIDSDPADLCAVEDELEGKLGLDLAEMSTVDAMLQRGAHPLAAVNKIRKGRADWSAAEAG
jgi:hypothetical protein